MLQLDIAGGSYDSTTQTIVSGGTSFSLYAIGTPQNTSQSSINALLSQTYYISAAITPGVASPGDLGYFTVDGKRVNATSDMTYGTPPIEQFQQLQGQDPGDLPSHDIYPTYFTEFAFKFDTNAKAVSYNTADNPGGLVASSSGGSYYHQFIIDTSHLNPNYVVHFDLYSEQVSRCGKPEQKLNPDPSCRDVDINQFAPFSHDAESSPPVPEPTSLVLLGTGLAAAGMRKFRKRPTA